jgi:preprotein translocase subunit YajC
MQTLTIDLKREPEIADLVADLQPGDPVLLHTTIKAMDDQTLTLTLEEAEEGQANPDAGNELADDESTETPGATDEPDATPEGSSLA